MVAKAAANGEERPRSRVLQVNMDVSDCYRMLSGNVLKEVERGLILATLEQCDGVQSDAARVLNVSTRTIRNKLRQYERDGKSRLDSPGYGTAKTER